MFTVVVATLGVNIAANVVSPANDFANLFPGKISFKTGGLLTGIFGVLMMPWKLLADPSGYIFTWLGGYSGGLGAIGGVLVTDYWMVRKTELRLADLYRRRGVYQYEAFGVNLAGRLRHHGGLRARLDRRVRALAAPPVRLRVVRRLLRRRRGVLGGDARGATPSRARARLIRAERSAVAAPDVWLGARRGVR